MPSATRHARVAQEFCLPQVGYTRGPAMTAVDAGREKYPSGRRLDQPFCCGAGFLGDFGPCEHARDLLAAAVGGNFVDPRRDPLATIERILGDDIMAVGARGDLRGVCDGDRLYAAGE